MIYVTIYGLGTADHERIKMLIKNTLEQGRVPYIIRDDTSIDSFLSRELESVPAVEINGEIYGKHNGKTDNQYISEVLSKLINKIKTNKDAIHNRSN